MSHRPKGFYENLENIPQVRLLSPKESSHELLSHCALVCTIAGTIGWEALLAGKPVITFGDTFINCFEGTAKCRDWGKLADVMGIALKSSNDISHEKLIAFVGAVKRLTYPGDWLEYILPNCSLENIENICLAFRRKMGLESK
jgi:capsule polysaccharide export protein KpsC/LpsZ